MSGAGQPSPIQAPSNVQVLSWAVLKLVIVFFVGGLFVALLADTFFAAISLLFDVGGYPNPLSKVVRMLLESSRASPFFILIVIFYAKAQFLNAVFALLSFVVLKRVSLLGMILVAPLVAYTSGLSYSVAWLWPTDRSASSLAAFALVGFQLIVTISCWLLLQHKLIKSGDI